MQNLPLIGLTGRRILSGKIADSLPVLAEADVDLYYAAYGRSVSAAGGLPLHLPLDVEAPSLIARLDGILFCGGDDIDPARYGAQRAPEVEPPEPKRDQFELELMRAAIGCEIPVLGICRGMQLLNVALGGTLHQHVPSHAKTDQPGDTESHRVDVLDGSTLSSFYGSIKNVNSLHHQVVDQVGSELIVVAQADGGSVEALEHARLPIIGVQWHPEMLATKNTDPAFSWLVKKASERMKSRLR